MVVTVLSRRGLDRRRQKLPCPPQGSDLHGHRWNCRGADNLAARADRRYAKLGLSLLLAARRDLYAAGLDARRLLRRGPRMARLAAAGGRGQSRPIADHVRAWWRAPINGMGGAVAVRVRRLATGPDRQRRGR